MSNQTLDIKAVTDWREVVPVVRPLTQDINLIRQVCAQQRQGLVSHLLNTFDVPSDLNREAPLRTKGICDDVTEYLLEKFQELGFQRMSRAMMFEEKLKENKDVVLWGPHNKGFFFWGHTFVVVDGIIVDAAFHQYLDAFNIAHEEPDDVLVVPYAKLDDKIDEFVRKCQVLPQGVRGSDHLKNIFRKIWDYKLAPSHTHIYDQNDKPDWCADCSKEYDARYQPRRFEKTGENSWRLVNE